MNTTPPIALPEGVRLIDLPHFDQAARGCLTVAEAPENLPFIPQRLFWISQVSSGEVRGDHAHRQCAQFILCIHGSCQVRLSDGSADCQIKLASASQGLFVPPLTWVSCHPDNADSCLLVLASRRYEKEDYIFDLQEMRFLRSTAPGS